MTQRRCLKLVKALGAYQNTSSDEGLLWINHPAGGASESHRHAMQGKCTNQKNNRDSRINQSNSST